MDKVAARGHHCACPCCPCLKTWETTVGWPGRLHGGWAGASRRGPAYCPKPLWNTNQGVCFPLHRPSKIIGTLMQGKPWVDKVAARGPHCAWLCYPCLKTWGNRCWLAWTGPWRSSGRCRGEGQVGVVCWKGKNHWVSLSNWLPPIHHHPDPTPWPADWGLQHRRATYNDHLDTR